MSHDEIRVIGACPACNNYPGDCHCKDWLAENVRLQEDLSREREQRRAAERERDEAVERVDTAYTALVASQREVERLRKAGHDEVFWVAEDIYPTDQGVRYVKDRIAEEPLQWTFSIHEAKRFATRQEGREWISDYMRSAPCHHVTLESREHMIFGWRSHVASLESQLAEAKAEAEALGTERVEAHGMLDAATVPRAYEMQPPPERHNAVPDRIAALVADRDAARSQLATSEASAAAMRESLQTLATKELPGRYEEAAQWVRDTALRGVAAEAAKGVLSRLEKAEALAKSANEARSELLLFAAGRPREVIDRLTLDLAAYAAAKSKDATDE